MQTDSRLPINHIRMSIQNPNLPDAIYIDDVDNEWPLNNPGLYRRFSQPIFPYPLIIYFPNPFTVDPIKLVYPPGMSTIDILGAIVTFYQRPITEEERQLALDKHLDDFIPSLRHSSTPVTVGDFYLNTPIFEGLYRYDNGWSIRLGQEMIH
jgi:hypothetical protein